MSIGGGYDTNIQAADSVVSKVVVHVKLFIISVLNRAGFTVRNSGFALGFVTHRFGATHTPTSMQGWDSHLSQTPNVYMRHLWRVFDLIFKLKFGLSNHEEWFTCEDCEIGHISDHSIPQRSKGLPTWSGGHCSVHGVYKALQDVVVILLAFCGPPNWRYVLPTVMVPH